MQKTTLFVVLDQPDPDGFTMTLDRQGHILFKARPTTEDELRACADALGKVVAERAYNALLRPVMKQHNDLLREIEREFEDAEAIG